MTAGREDQADDLRHLTEEQLAELAERGTHPTRDEPAIRHLARCRTCMAAYADAVRYRGAWLAVPELFESKGQLPSAERRPVRVAGIGPAARVAWIGVAAGVVVAAAVGLHFARQPSVTDPLPPGALAQLLVRSSGADLVYPGGEAGAALQATPYRSGLPDSGEFEVAIDSLRLRYEHGARQPSDLYLLSATLLAAGRLDLASDYVAEGRATAPKDARFLVLAAMLSRRQGDDAGALQQLREARKLAPRDLTLMLDHAMLLSESGANEEATTLLREVIRRAPNSALAERARRLLSAGDPR